MSVMDVRKIKIIERMGALGVVGLALEGRVAILMRISRSRTWQPRLADGRLVGSVDHAAWDRAWVVRRSRRMAAPLRTTIITSLHATSTAQDASQQATDSGRSSIGLCTVTKLSN